MSLRPVYLDEAGFRGLIEMLAAVDYPETALDDAVHDVASAEASNVNNGGLDDQVTYLLAHGLSSEEILAAARQGS